MTMNWKRNSKKYIAGILTIALAVGAGQSYGSMEVSAQERTLPGIEKLVQDTVASSDGTFHILEIVPSKEAFRDAVSHRAPDSYGQSGCCKVSDDRSGYFFCLQRKHRSFQNRGRKRTLCIPTGRIRQIQLPTDRCGLS